MLERLKRRLSFANVMSAIAVFVALSAGAYAALGPNSVGSRQIKKGAVKPSDLAKRSGLTIQGGSAGNLPTGPNADHAVNPFGGTGDTSTPRVAVAPVNLVVSNLRVTSSAPLPGETRRVGIRLGDSDGGTMVLACNIPTGAAGCKTAGKGTIKAGQFYYVRFINGPAGVTNQSATWGFTLKAK